MKQFKIAAIFVSLLAITVGSCEFEEINYQKPVPVALEAIAITSNGFTAVWNPVEGSGSYTVLVLNSSTFNSNNPNADNIVGGERTTGRTTLRVTDLEADRAYYYTVKVSDDDRNVEYSNIITVRTLPLASPQALDAKDVTPLSFSAQWKSVPEAEGYRLYVATDINFTEFLEGYEGKVVSDTTAIVDGLEVNNDYFYRLETVRGKSVSQVSNAIQVSTSRLKKPVLRDASEINFTSFTINWEEVQGATSYQIFVGTDPNVITDVLPGYNPLEVTGATSRPIVELNANTTYYYRVQAKNDLSASEKSDVGSIQTISLNAPVARAATAVRINGFQANWHSVPEASSYVLDVARDVNFTSLLNGYQAKEVVDTSEVISGLSRNTSYYYRVRTKGFGAVSDNSEEISVQTVSFASPKALEAEELQTNSFRAVWQSVSSADRYRIDVATDANFENVLASYDNREINDTTLQITGLTVNRRYFYRVRALKGAVFSGYSNIIDLTTTSLSEPTLSPTTEVKLTSFRINWEAVSGATEYRVDVGFDPLLENKISADYDDRPVVGTSLEVTVLQANTTYYFRVRAKNNVSTGGSSTGSAKTASIDPPEIADPTQVMLTSFQANWETVEDAEGYLLDVATDEDFKNLIPNFSGRELFGQDVNSMSVTDLSPNRLYHYRVRAKGLGSTSAYSTAEVAKTSPLPAPIARAATNQEPLRFTANWDTSTGADRYLLYVATDASFDPDSVLEDYNGVEVLGTSYVVTGLNPYQSYHYRLQSKQSATVSEFSNDITVGARIPAGCRITEREFAGQHLETYSYRANGAIDGIKLYDISGPGSTLIKESEFFYDAGRIDRVDVVDFIVGTDQIWMFAYDGQRISSISINDASTPLLSPAAEVIDFTYDTDDKLDQLTFRENGVVVGAEKYTHLANRIEVDDENDDPIKYINTKAGFNTESMLPDDVALLLFNPTDPNERPLPFILKQTPELYYYYRTSGNIGYPQAYDYNAQRIPLKIFATADGVPEITYSFSCTIQP